MNSLLKTIESPTEIPSKSEIADFASNLAKELESVDVLGLRVHSTEDILKCFAAVKAAEELAKKLKEQLSPIVINALVESGAKKTTAMYGAKFTIKDSTPEYDFSASEEWKEMSDKVKELKQQLAEANEALKAQQDLLIATKKAKVLWENGQTLSVSLA